MEHWHDKEKQDRFQQYGDACVLQHRFVGEYVDKRPYVQYHNFRKRY